MDEAKARAGRLGVAGGKPARHILVGNLHKFGRHRRHLPSSRSVSSLQKRAFRIVALHDSTKRHASRITVSGKQGRLRLPLQAARTKGPPKARTRR
jgi:hypothetical protein